MFSRRAVPAVAGKPGHRAVTAKNPLAPPGPLNKRSPWNREQNESALARGQPFTLLMADGREYRVPHRDYLSFPPKAPYVIVYDDVGHFTALPLQTMTGLRVAVAENRTSEK